MVAPLFELSFKNKGDILAVYLSGDIDYTAVLELEPKIADLLDSSNCDIIFDLDRVQFIDSEGIKLLLLMVNKARFEGRSAAVVNCNGFVNRTFQLTGVTEYLANSRQEIESYSLDEKSADDVPVDNIDQD